MRYFAGFDEAVVVDVETTGLDPETDRIVSVSMLRADFSALQHHPNRLEGDTLDALFNPQCKIPPAATQIHGITDEDVADNGPFAESAQQLREFISARPIIAHNAAFDKTFLSAEFKRAGVKTLQRNKSYCTMLRYQQLQGGRRQDSNLDAAAQQLGVPGRRSVVHEAAEDVRITCELARGFYLADNGHIAPRPSRTTSQGDGVGCLVVLLAFLLVGLITAC